MLPLVEYDCGCIGFVADENDDAVILMPCDHPAGRGTISLEVRSMTGRRGSRAHTPWLVDSKKLSQPGAVFQELQRLIRDGQMMRKIRECLKD
jgi:hypothetical protein